MDIPAGLSPIISDVLQDASGDVIRHGYFTRLGGVSEGIYEGLNVGLGSRDTPQRVIENRARVASWFGQPIEKLATVHQIHSPDVFTVTGNYAGERPEADALVTATPGIVLGVLAADCGPVLFADAENRVIGAAHAGWKGALYGVLESTIDAMIALGARRETITAVLGPSISAANYEVGPEFVARFLDINPDYARYFSPSVKEDHAMFDLQGLTAARLKAAGVNAAITGHCTYVDEERFFSYRRTTHRKEPDYGRQISAIQINRAA
ncbi:peptidoglycan editing factor PgeF [Rhizobium sp. C4]|uniref:peptidoglycan editing factor PgeF n=1 Tax=Rhizobium sp. C4 TaxID=1349800 RepID=UPI001E58104E|nr:peptidoglycan editing factor PgeF [Rhizobium sp. C4]MCD2173706.1 peptidoglycan editing factor PgeF [Rhizobium sp. C4]